MAKFVNICGYNINPDHVVQIDQRISDILDEDNKFTIYLSDGRSLQFTTPVSVTKRDVIDCLEKCEDSNWLKGGKE